MLPKPDPPNPLKKGEPEFPVNVFLSKSGKPEIAIKVPLFKGI